MTAQQKADYAAYRKECRKNGIEPTKEDFLGIELTDEQLDARIRVVAPAAKAAMVGA
jgi:hypothetical protein